MRKTQFLVSPDQRDYSGCRQKSEIVNMLIYRDMCWIHNGKHLGITTFGRLWFRITKGKVKTCSISTCPLFLRAISFKATMIWARKFIDLLFSVFLVENPITQFILLIVYWDNLYIKSSCSSCEKYMPIFCFCFFCIFPKNPFSIFTSHKC